jgi:diguanylate cyclase (GGDEF)-like protein/PAS domain S-box-containing protein
MSMFGITFVRQAPQSGDPAREAVLPGAASLSPTGDVDASSSSLARRALMTTAILALAGSGLGVFAILQGMITGIEVGVVLSSGLAGTAVVVTLLAFRKVAIQTVATTSTSYYTCYLCAGMMLSFDGRRDHFGLFVYLAWFFPLLVFNKLVNSPAIGRFLARLILAAPLILLCALFFPAVSGNFTPACLLVAAASSLSYFCFGVMLNAVTRFREAYVAERERAESLKNEAEVLESISDCFISLDSEFRLVYMNDAACAEFLVGREAALHHTIPDAIPGFFSDMILDRLRSASAQAYASLFEARNEHRGSWYEMRCFPQPGRLSIYFRNITQSVLARTQLDAAHERLREQTELLDKSRDAIFVQDMDTRVLYWNKGAERLFGWTAEEALGHRTTEIFHQSAAEIKGALSAVARNGEWSGEILKQHRNGRILVVESRCTLLREDDSAPHSILVINTDITDRRTADARIHKLAFYDVLTGLPNRVLLRERLEAALAAAPEQKTMGALLLIDLDDFKTLNDTCGHELGDLLLKETATRLSSCVEGLGSVARFGGDEFVVVLEGLSPNPVLAGEEANAVAEKILRACRLPHSLDRRDYDGTTSVGVTLFHAQTDSVDDLLKRADLAMYRAKAVGRDGMCFFDPAMETAIASRAALLADLKRAPQNGEFELHYQPQVDSSRRVIGAEALLRWRHPQRGMVSPGEFIPLAESAGLIVDLGFWVLNTACRQIAEWSRRPQMEGLNIAVNVSIRQFLDSRFVSLVEKVLRETGANPHRLKLEITESFMVEKANDTIAKINAIKAHGVGFSMDDFGTGYSSLSQLKRLPLDQLKIDQSFVRDILNGVQDASIVRTILSLGRSLNLAVIAEGVETEAQREFLESQGCHAYQGYLFSPAVPAGGLEAFVEETCRLKAKAASREILLPLAAQAADSISQPFSSVETSSHLIC